MKDFAANLEKLRSARQMTISQLAKESGVSRARIYAFESGESTNPSLDVLTRLAKELSVTIADLIGSEVTVPVAHVVDIPLSLQEFAKREKRRGRAFSDADLQNLARIEYRGRRPQTAEDWQFVSEFLDRMLQSDG